jgi:homoserine kinase type II
MSVFTEVPLVEVSHWLARDYDLGAPTALDGIAGGVENTNYFLTTSRGGYVLTLFERLSGSELPYYLGLMAHLARAGVRCPAPVAARDGSLFGTLAGKPAAIVARLPGASVETPTIAHCGQIGRQLAELHLAGASYPRRQANPRGLPWCNATRERVAPFLGPTQRGLLDAELVFQSALDREQLPRGTIHADLFRDNVLFLGERIGGLIDFSFACQDALLFDLAVAVNDWCIDAQGELDPARTRAMLGAYHAARPLQPAEHEAWPGMLRAACLRFWLSRLRDLHLPRPGPIVLRKDPAWFEHMLALRAAAAVPPWP